jgi:uncharacterized membrane protein
MKKNLVLLFLLLSIIISQSINAFCDSTAVNHLKDSTRIIVTENSASHNGLFSAYPNLHPLVVHFPIVLLVFAAFFQLLYFWKKELNLAVLILLVAGTAGAWLAAEVFDANADFKHLSEAAKNIYRLHNRYADYTTWLSTVALALKLAGYFIRKKKMFLEVLVMLVLSASAVTVCITGHYGSHLVHVDGVGPKGNLLKPGE